MGEKIGKKIVDYAIILLVTGVGRFVGSGLYDGFMTLMEGRKNKKTYKDKAK